VSSFFPLEIYLFRGGFARFTNSRYSNNHSDIANSFIHLTNVAVQKTSENYNKKVGKRGWATASARCSSLTVVL
jgi:tubulin polyglutamylase TTLL9